MRMLTETTEGQPVPGTSGAAAPPNYYVMGELDLGANATDNQIVFQQVEKDYARFKTE